MNRLPVQRMIYIRINEYGPPEGLVADRAPIPIPRDGEVLIKVAAAGVNRADVVQRAGNYAPPPGASDVLGLEVAGHIVALGDNVTGWKVDDEVCALVSAGGYAEYCVAPAPQCLPVPKGLSLVEAAGIPETFFTVWTNVFERGKLKPGETILIHGGSSGIGTTALQLAKAFGAKVIITTGDDEKCAFCLKLGADSAINYRNSDFVEEVRKLTDGDGVDLILDIVGGSYIEKNIQLLKIEGRLVQVALLQGSRVNIDMMPVMVKRLTVTGSTLRTRTVEQKHLIAQAVYREVWPHLESGNVKPVIHKTFPLTAASKAHRLMESNKHIGKIILTVEQC